jgi:hypothetical protein
MFRKDFATGRFPISKRSPVIGFGKDGVTVAYNRRDLKVMANTSGNTLIGVWPGNRNTDLFYINLESYKDVPVPPDGHEDIDSAELVTIRYTTPEMFDHVVYILPEQTPIICKDPKIVDYIRKSGIKHTVVFDSI